MVDIFNVGSGSWRAASTWNLDRVPSVSRYNVFINFVDDEHPTSSTVTLTGQGYYANLVVGDRNTLALSDGDAGSTGNYLQVNAGGTLLAEAGKNKVHTRINVHVGGTVEVADGASLSVEGNIKYDIENFGQIFLSAKNKLTEITSPVGLLTLIGRGTVTLSDSAENLITNLRNVDNTISGAGTIRGQIENQHDGVIRADGARNPLIIDPGSNGKLPGGVLKNAGRIETVGKGLQIGVSGETSRVENSGAIEAIGGSTAVLTSVNVDNAKGAIVASGKHSHLELQDSHIRGGTIMTIGAGLVVTGANSVTDSIVEAGNVTVKADSSLKVSGGSFSIDGDLVDAGVLSIQTPLTLQGGKSASVAGTLRGNARLINVDDALSGSGTVHVGSLWNQAKGHIDGNLELTADELRNAGSIAGIHVTSTRATNTGTMTGVRLRASSFDNSGVVSDAVFDGRSSFAGTFTNETGGIINNSAFDDITVSNHGLVQADDGDLVTFAGTHLVGGTLSSSNGGVLRTLNAERATLLQPDQVAVGTTLAIDGGTSATLRRRGGAELTLDGVSIFLNGKNWETRLRLAGSVRLEGSGRITLSDSSDNRLEIDKLVNAKGVIAGAGEVTGDADSSLSNQTGGTIDANGKNRLTVNVGQLSNDGLLEADGGTLRVVTDNAIRGGGHVLATNGGIVDLSRTKSFRGTFEYAGRGSIIGPTAVPMGTIFGFSTGDSYAFGQTTTMTSPLAAVWQENAANTGGTLTIEQVPGHHTYATLQLAGVYTSSDFTATEVTLAGAKHVVVNFAGAHQSSAGTSGSEPSLTPAVAQSGPDPTLASGAQPAASNAGATDPHNVDIGTLLLRFSHAMAAMGGASAAALSTPRDLLQHPQPWMLGAPH